MLTPCQDLVNVSIGMSRIESKNTWQSFQVYIHRNNRSVILFLTSLNSINVTSCDNKNEAVIFNLPFLHTYSGCSKIFLQTSWVDFSVKNNKNLMKTYVRKSSYIFIRFFICFMCKYVGHSYFVTMCLVHEAVQEVR